MPNYQSSGEENLRADAQVYSSSDVNKTPGAKGANAGGEANLGGDTKVMSEPSKTTPQGKTSTPAGVKTYSED